jgi:hypothetical protein
LDTIGRLSCPHRFFDDIAWFRCARHGAGLVVAVLFGGCLHAGPQGTEPAGPAPGQVSESVPGDSPGLQVPGTFSRVGFCGGKWGDEVFLTLLPDGVFSLRQTYRDAGCVPQLTLVYIGRWNMAADGSQLRLDNGPVWLRRLTVVDRQTLSIPEAPDTARPSTPVYQTAYPARLVPFRDPFRLQGLVSLVPRS